MALGLSSALLAAEVVMSEGLEAREGEGVASAAPATDTAAGSCGEVPEPDRCRELLALREEDQEIRQRYLEAPESEAIHAEMLNLNRRHLARVVEILEADGWPGISEVGAKASQGAWLIIQHADLETQKRYLPLMQEAAEQGELPGRLLATTVDRVRVRQGQKQLYGTQYTRGEDGRLMPQPIEDPEGVDARRREVGLKSLEEATNAINEAYRRPDPESKASGDKH
ncbi:MAG: DUF6624 domain-containing protein [Acidobacteriota bacterium]|nr:DUF6624 domain-containing protein [Acidobacteriota bacterium]